MTEQYEFHPLANKFPLLEGKEFEELVDDIAANGLRQEIVLHEDKILDGRNRYRACRQAGVVPRYKDFDGDDPVAFVISANIHRRHLTPEDRAARLAQLVAAQPEKSDRELAKLAGVAHTTIARARERAEATGAAAPVEKRVGADGKARKQPNVLTFEQREEQAGRRRTKKDEARKARDRAIAAQLPDDIHDLLDKAESAEEEFREYTVETWTTRAEETVDHVKAEAAARSAIAAWTRLADGIRKKASPAGNDSDPQESADARKAAFAKAESKPAPAAKKKRGRPAGSKNKKKAA